MTAENIKTLASTLSLKERADLAAYLIATLDADAPGGNELSDAELDRRWAEVERGEVVGSTWDEVRARGRRASWPAVSS